MFSDVDHTIRAISYMIRPLQLKFTHVELHLAALMRGIVAQSFG